jgi:hypothetical protein
LPSKIPLGDVIDDVAQTLFKTLSSYEKFLELIYRIVHPEFKVSAKLFLPPTFTPLPPTTSPLLANFNFVQEPAPRPKLTSSSSISITLTRNPSFGGSKRGVISPHTEPLLHRERGSDEGIEDRKKGKKRQSDKVK